jgi:hypothetical protein
VLKCTPKTIAIVAIIRLEGLGKGICLGLENKPVAVAVIE